MHAPHRSLRSRSPRFPLSLFALLAGLALAAPRDARAAPTSARPLAAASDTGGYTGRQNFWWKTSNGIVYVALLTAANYQGIVDVAYRDGDGIVHEVTEDVTLQQMNGVYFVGSNPRDSNTGNTLRNYHPDTFRIQIADDGGWMITQACDDQECSTVQLGRP